MFIGLFVGWRSTDYLIWGLFMLLVVLGWLVGLWAEHRHYQRLGKARSWTIMRLALLPFMATVTLAVVLPTRWVGGPEALGVFYVGLFIVAPLLWWGLHLLLGRWVTPAFTSAESGGLAWMALGALLLPVLLANQLHGTFFALSEKWQSAQRRQALQGPLPLTVTPPRVWSTGQQPVLMTQALFLNPGVTLEAMEYLEGTVWQDAARSIHPGFCVSEGQVHVLASEAHPAMPLRFYWRNDGGPLRQSTFYPQSGIPAGANARPLSIQWRDDGVDFPVTLPRDAVLVSPRPTSGLPPFRLMTVLAEDEGDCLQPGSRLPLDSLGGPVALMRIQLLAGGGRTEQRWDWARSAPRAAP